MKPSPELVEAAREAFYNNQGRAGDDPIELMLSTLKQRGLVSFTSRQVIAKSNLPPSELEAKVMLAWREYDGDLPYYSFKWIAACSNVPDHQVRRAVRALARKGFLELAKGLFTDEGTLAGSGYGPTRRGDQWLKDHSGGEAR